jgi:hypothetical protein
LAERQFTAHAVDAHGAGKFENLVSTRFYEVYRNRVVSATRLEAGTLGFATSNFAMAFRGGEGAVFGNWRQPILETPGDAPDQARQRQRVNDVQGPLRQDLPDPLPVGPYGCLSPAA